MKKRNRVFQKIENDYTEFRNSMTKNNSVKCYWTELIKSSVWWRYMSFY